MDDDVRRDPNWCDLCERLHGATPNHCLEGKHCTATDAACAASDHVDDHGSRCHDCGAPLPIERAV